MKRLEELDAYLTGEMVEADAFEESLFDSPDDPDVLLVDRIARHGAELVARGTFHSGITRAELDAIAAKHEVYVLECVEGVEIRSEFPPTAEFFVTTFALGRPDITHVDVETIVVNLGVSKTIRDVRVDNGTIYGICERPLAEIAHRAGPTIARVRRAGGPKEEGNREVIAEFRFLPVG